MNPRRQAEREIDSLENELAQADDPAERLAIQRAMRDVEREVGEFERWEDEGHERGWR